MFIREYKKGEKIFYNDGYWSGEGTILGFWRGNENQLIEINKFYSNRKINISELPLEEFFRLLDEGRKIIPYWIEEIKDGKDIDVYSIDLGHGIKFIEKEYVHSK